MTLWEWCHWRTRALRAEAMLRDEKAARQATLDHYRTALLRVDAATCREKALQAALESSREYSAQVELERDDARRENDEVRAALVWLEGEWFGKAVGE